MSRKWLDHAPWFWKDIFTPFIFTRVLLLLIGWFAQYLPVNTSYPIQKAAIRGWQFTHHRLIDIWARWDSGWYLDIVLNGYSAKSDLAAIQSNLAFFPFYPYLTRWIAWLPSNALQSRAIVLLVGVLISNFFLLSSLVLIWKLVKLNDWSDDVARRAVFYLLFFPTAFFFSCFYTESAFLFLSLAAFYVAHRQNWALAGLLGGLLAVTRVFGVLILIPLLWMTFEAIDWKFDQIRWNIIWLSLVPLGLIVHLLSIYPLSHHLMTPMVVQSAWGRKFSMPWDAWIESTKLTPIIAPLDLIFTVGFLLLCIYVWRKFRSKSYALYSVLLLIPLLFSGSLQSNDRYVLVVFPAFVALALFTQKWWVNAILMPLFLGLQLILLAAWSQFYWVG
ncbi:MAG: hypothetical protein GYA34_10880 [Chloroflexi bacterium]|nr:hypothetical protein [Chloroflexota bacterium]